MSDVGIKGECPVTGVRESHDLLSATSGNELINTSYTGTCTLFFHWLQLGNLGLIVSLLIKCAEIGRFRILQSCRQHVKVAFIVTQLQIARLKKVCLEGFQGLELLLVRFVSV